MLENKISENEIINNLSEIVYDSANIAVLLVGSTAAFLQGVQVKPNDVDVIVVTDDFGKILRQVDIRAGIIYDITFISKDIFEKYIAEKQFFLIKAMKHTKVLFSKIENLNKKLQGLFVEELNSTVILSNQYIDLIRFEISHSFEDIRNRLEDGCTANLLMNDLMTEVLAAFFKLNGSIVPKNKKIIDVLKEKDLILYKKIENYYGECKKENKFALMDEIVIYVLQPFGGRKITWEKGEFPIK